jgi:EAL domain-containing protein (putative c-di-GMP-specific phosphodiesterase class I)
VDVLKIDQSFIRNITPGTSDAAIVETIITMARNLDLQVVTEGVETEQEFDFLRAHGCGAFQGYYFSAALPMRELVPLLEARGGVLVPPAQAA